MKKKIRFSAVSQYESHAGIRVQHVLPNRFVQAIGPFVLLDYLSSYKETFNESLKEIAGTCPRPCRGVSILTYIINGEVEHSDSLGNHVKLNSGAAHWMNAGKGIVHNEVIRPEFQINSPHVSIVRFWINLPSKNKCEEPDYLSLLQNAIPKLILPNEAGWIKVLCGTYNDIEAKVPSYSKQLLYHLHLEEGKHFSIVADTKLEYAAFLLTNNPVINDTEFQMGELIVFNSPGELIEISNYDNAAVDIIMFGGEPYNEPMVLEETFVMNNPHEITQAYNDYYDGKYGDIHGQEINKK